VVIKKSNYSLYRGVLSETKTWYLLIDSENGAYYLANLDRPNEGVYDWFVRFKDSQNIYKSFNGAAEGNVNNLYKTLHFKKENEPTDILNFYIENQSSDAIILTALSDGMVYCFQLQNQ